MKLRKGSYVHIYPSYNTHSVGRVDYICKGKDKGLGNILVLKVISTKGKSEDIVALDLIYRIRDTLVITRKQARKILEMKKEQRS